MKRFFSLICSLLLVFVFVSCGNLTLDGKSKLSDPTKGTIFIRIPKADTSRAAGLKAQTDVKKFQIKFDSKNVDDVDYSYTRDELDAGVRVSLEPDEYNVYVFALDENDLILFYGENKNSIQLTLENTADNPAVVEIDMNYVLASLASGPDVKTINKRVVTLSGSSMPDTITPTTGFPMADQEIVSWTDSNNGNAVYIVGQAISLEGKNLPLCLTANWQPKKQTEITGYFSNNGTPYGMGIDGCSKKIELAQDNTFPIPGDSLYERFKAFFPEGSVITGWKDASGKFYELNAHIPYEELYGLPSFELYAQWTIPAPVKYYLNTNMTENSANPDPITTANGSTIAMPLPQSGGYTLDPTYYIWTDPDDDTKSYVFCGWSTVRVPVLTSENYNEQIEVLKTAGVVNWGNSITLSADETTFYAVWMDTEIADAKLVRVECRGDDGQDPERKYLFCLNDFLLVEDHFSYILPDMRVVLDQWGDFPKTINAYWTLYGTGSAETTTPGQRLEFDTDESEIIIVAKCKIPFARYFDGGDQYGSVNREYSEMTYVERWPFPDEIYLMFGAPKGVFAADLIYAARDSGVYWSNWEFDHWVDENGETYSGGYSDFLEVTLASLPLKLTACWKAPYPDELATGTETAISSFSELKTAIQANPSGTFYLTKNLAISAQDLTEPIVDTFNGTLYGNYLTVDFQGTTSSLFNEIGTNGKIYNFNISGYIDNTGYNSSLSVKSLLCQTNNGLVQCCQYRLKDGTSFPTVDCLFGGYGNADKYDFYDPEAVGGTIMQWDSTRGWVTYTGNDAPALTKQVTAGGNPNIQSGTSFTGYPVDGTIMPTNIYYAGSFEVTRYIAFLGLETPLIDNTTIEMISHSRDFDFWCTPEANIYNNPQAEYTVSSYLTLGNFGANADNYLTADVIKTESGNTSTVASGVVIQSITRDGVYLKYTYDYTYYDCFLFTPRGLFNMVNGNYNPGNRMPSPILCSGQISKDAITQTINTITEWE